jgi:hypothetical protein
LQTQLRRGAQKRPACASAAETRCVEMMSAGIANSRNAIVGSCLRHLRLLSVWRCFGVRLFLLTKPWRQVFQSRLSVPGRCLHQSQMRLRWLDCRVPDRAHQQCRQSQGHGWSDTHGRHSVLSGCVRRRSPYVSMRASPRTVPTTGSKSSRALAGRRHAPATQTKAPLAPAGL